MSDDLFSASLVWRAQREELGNHQRLRWLQRATQVDVLPVRRDEAESAQRAVHELNNLGSEPLAEWLAGDIGGGIRLTPRGRRLSVALLVMQQAEARLLKQLGGSFADDLRLLDRVTVRTSARNQFFARVESIGGEALQEEITLRLRGDLRMRATLTHSSVEALELKPGSEVVALIKAPALRVFAPEEEDPRRRDAGLVINRFDGVVRALCSDERYVERMVDLGHGLTAIAASPLSAPPIWGCGDCVALSFSASDVILGVPG